MGRLGVLGWGAGDSDVADGSIVRMSSLRVSQPGEFGKGQNSWTKALAKCLGHPSVSLEEW